MANPIFYYNKGLTFQSITATSSNTAYPASNLNLGFPDKGWVSNDMSSGQSIIWRIASADIIGIDKTWILFSGVNFGTLTGNGATIVLDCASDAGFSTNRVILATNPTSDGLDFSLRTFSAFTTQTYFRLTYTGSLTEPPRIGMIFHGKQLTFGFTPSYPFVGGKGTWNTSEFEALDGRLHSSQQAGSRLLWEVKFDYALASIETNIASFFNAIRGKLNPFWYCDHNSLYYFVKMDNDQDMTEAVRAGFVNVKKLTMKSVLRY
jgi:hypothetical protein